MQAQSNGATAVKPPPVDRLTYGDGVEVSIEIIDPGRAREMLTRNQRNRKLRDRRVRNIAAAINGGDWVFNGDAIRFDIDGKLLDGQHRLEGCVQADEAIVALVVTGLPPEAQDTVDLGSKRTVADTLRMREVPYATVVGGSMVLLNAWMRHGSLNRGGGRGYDLTPAVALRMLEEHPELPRHAKFGMRDAFRSLASPVCWATASYIITRVDEEDAAAFFESVGSGVGLFEGDARYALREKLLATRNLKATTVSQAARLWMVCRAWNAFVAREELRTLRIPPSLLGPGAWPDVEGDTLRFSKQAEAVRG